MKFDLQWHKGCVVNMRRTAEVLKQNMETAIRAYEEIKVDVEQYEHQIICAINEGKNDFDRDRYKIPVKRNA
jgi:hypothetical protein